MRHAWGPIALALGCLVAGLGGHYWGLQVPVDETGSGLVVAGQAVHRPSQVKGALRADAVSFSSTADGAILDPPLLPAENPFVYGFFLPRKNVPLSRLQAKWTWNGTSMGPVPLEIAQTSHGVCARMRVERPGGAPLGPGVGEVEVEEGGRRVARGSFVTAASATAILAQAAPPATPTRLVSIRIEQEGRTTRGASQPAAVRGDRPIKVVFSFEGADAGASFVVRWSCEGRELPKARAEITATGEKGSAVAWIAAKAPDKLPKARYRVEVFYGSQAMPLGGVDFEVAN